MASGTAEADGPQRACPLLRGREADVLALWDSPRQREAYGWFTLELANLRAGFRWAADHDDIDTAATIATYSAFIGTLVEQYEPLVVGRGDHRTRACPSTSPPGGTLYNGDADLPDRTNR